MVTKTTVIDLGTIRVDACEMIMGIPEAVIQEQYRIDARGQMRLGMNGLIVETKNRVVLFDPGCATFMSRSLAEEYDLVMDKSLKEVIGDAGYAMDEITDVVFTHLHFDHGSGAFLRIQGGIIKAFPEARYVVSKQQLDHIATLGKESQNSFFHKLLRFAADLVWAEEWGVEGIEFRISDGHTCDMLVPVIDMGDHQILYATDLIPTRLHLVAEAVSYYDEDKELLKTEKKKIIENMDPGTEFIFYHEPPG